MSQPTNLDRRSFFRRTLAGGAALGLVSQPWWEAAAQLVEGTPIRNVRGVGLDDPALVQLSINENPLGSSRYAIEAVAKAMFGMNRYPFHDQLEEALAQHHGLPMEMILTGIGSSEILNLLVLAAFWDRGGNIVTAFPSYPSIPGKTEELGREVRRIPLEPDFGIDLDAMAAAIDSETRIVSVCNPNNPTGQLLDAAELRRFVEAVPKDVIICMDEAYIHFVDDPDYPSTIPLAQEHDNVLVARTFSKAYGLGGVRVGYGIGHPELLKRLARFGLGRLNKNTLSIAAALGALEDPEHVARSVELVREGKAYLSSQLREMGYEPLQTQTIFVTVEVGPNTKTFVELLQEQRIAVRQAFDMDGYMRVSVGLPRENAVFVEEFRKLAVRH
jgi:histidinol-phosphate aminotransferase